MVLRNDEREKERFKKGDMTRTDVKAWVCEQ